jgi:hypothetical protein
MKAKYKYVRVPIRAKRRKASRPSNEGYGLFSASDIGFDFGSSKGSRQSSSIGSFDFGGAYGGKPAKQFSVKQQYVQEKKKIDSKLEDLRYSRKLDQMKKANSDFDNARRREFVGNVKSGAEKVGTTISSLFKRK